jgi:hypothetical protein
MRPRRSPGPRQAFLLIAIILYIALFPSLKIVEYGFVCVGNERSGFSKRPVLLQNLLNFYLAVHYNTLDMTINKDSLMAKSDKKTYICLY